MKRKKNRVEVWAGRGRHLYIVQAVAQTVVPDTALHPPRRRESNMNLGLLLHSLCRQLLTIWHDIELSPFGFVEVLPFVFMGLGAICVDQATRGIPGPPGLVPVAPFRWGNVEGQEAPPTLDTVCFFLTSYLWCFKAELPRQRYKLTINYFYYGSFSLHFYFFMAFWDSHAM